MGARVIVVEVIGIPFYIQFIYAVHILVAFCFTFFPFDISLNFFTAFSFHCLKLHIHKVHII